MLSSVSEQLGMLIAWLCLASSWVFVCFLKCHASSQFGSLSKLPSWSFACRLEHEGIPATLWRLLAHSNLINLDDVYLHLE